MRGRGRGDVGVKAAVEWGVWIGADVACSMGRWDEILIRR